MKVYPRKVKKGRAEVVFDRLNTPNDVGMIMNDVGRVKIYPWELIHDPPEAEIYPWGLIHYPPEAKIYP